MKRVLVISLAVSMSLLLAGCDNDSDHDNTSALAGSAWRLTAWADGSLDPSRFTITATFDDSQISGTSAVNLYGGNYSADVSGNFSVGALACTEMAGPEDAMRAESIYLQLLQRARKYSMSETVLILRDSGNNDLLTFDRN